MMVELPRHSIKTGQTFSEDYDKQEHSRCHKLTERLGGFLVFTGEEW